MTQKIIFLITLIAATSIFGCNEDDTKPELSTFEFETSLESIVSEKVNINLVSSYYAEAYNLNGSLYDAEYRSYVITDGKYVIGKSKFNITSYENATYLFGLNIITPVAEGFKSGDYPIAYYGKSCTFYLIKAGDLSQCFSDPTKMGIVSIALEGKSIEINFNDGIWQYVFNENDEFVEMLELNASLFVKGTIKDLRTL